MGDFRLFGGGERRYFLGCSVWDKEVLFRLLKEGIWSLNKSIYEVWRFEGVWYIEGNFLEFLCFGSWVWGERAEDEKWFEINSLRLTKFIGKGSGLFGYIFWDFWNEFCEGS